MIMMNYNSTYLISEEYVELLKLKNVYSIIFALQHALFLGID